MNAIERLLDEFGITEDELIEWADNEVQPGVCLSCGEIHEEVDPDCSHADLGCCKRSRVSSAMELLTNDRV